MTEREWNDLRIIHGKLADIARELREGIEIMSMGILCGHYDGSEAKNRRLNRLCSEAKEHIQDLSCLSYEMAYSFRRDDEPLIPYHEYKPDRMSDTCAFRQLTDKRAALDKALSLVIKEDIYTRRDYIDTAAVAEAREYLNSAAAYLDELESMNGGWQNDRAGRTRVE